MTRRRAADELGGAVRVAARGCRARRLAAIVDWLEAECARLGVTLERGREVDRRRRGAVRRRRGAVHRRRARARRTYEVDDGATVRHRGRRCSPAPRSPTGAVAVWDPIGGPIGISVAERSRRDGRDVHLVTPDLIAGNELSRSGDLAPANVRLPRPASSSSSDRCCDVSPATRSARGPVHRRAARAARSPRSSTPGYRLPDDALWRATGERSPRAGDAVAPRTIHEAILEGPRAALALERVPRGAGRRCRRIMSRYRYLFTPLRSGRSSVRNRIVFSRPPHQLRRATACPTEQHAAYYAARAAGGAGLIITEEHSTHPTDWPYEKLIHGFHREVIPGYRRITDAVHRHGTPIFAQINHNGGQASSMYTRLPVWAPSPVADPLFREVPKAVDDGRDRRDRRRLRDWSPSTAPRAASTASSCSARTRSIVRGFLSPATNLRTDEYGGSLDQPRPPAARDRRRRARRHRHATSRSACASAATS